MRCNVKQMQEWIFRNSDGEKVFLRLDQEYLHIVPKCGGDEEIAIPVGEIDKITFDLPRRLTQLVIHRGKEEIYLFGSAKMEEKDILELLPGLNVYREEEKLTAKDWGSLALLIAGAVGLIAPMVYLSGRSPVWMLGVYPLFALLDASTASRWKSWLKTALIGLVSWKLIGGITVVDWKQTILPGLLVTAALFLLMLLASRAKPKRAGRRLLALTLITALVYGPQASVVLNAMLPAKSRESVQTVVTGEGPSFRKGSSIRVEDCGQRLSTLRFYDKCGEIEYQIITGGLGIDYIVVAAELDELNEMYLAR